MLDTGSFQKIVLPVLQGCGLRYGDRQCVAVFAIVVQIDLQHSRHRHIGADAYFIGGAAVQTFDRMFRHSCVLQS